jgi:acyl-homoserine-lactone acylase
MAAGRDSIQGDFAGRMAHDYAAETFHLLSSEVREVLDGFARGVNDFVRLHGDLLPEWVKPEFDAHDIAARDIRVWNSGAALRFARSRMGGGEAGNAEVGHGPNPDDGSNAWAFAPSRTASGKAILVRNPHLSWDAGYYEAHLTVPGILNFYGDFRLGGPFTIIGGFNEHLGWSTTNNYPDLDEVYALLRDPDDSDRYLFDTGSVPIETKQMTVEFSERDSVGSETREFRYSPLGPIIHEVEDTVFVLKAHAHSQFRLGEQWLGMMRARNLEEWKEAMRIRAKYSSNFTYADSDGNVLLVWNAATPSLPHPPSTDSAIFVSTSNEVWTELVPWDDLPQILNPEGGYVQNANDPPYFTNLNQILDPAGFPENLPEPRLRFRSQNSLELVHTDDVLSLEDVVALKHSMKMILADRVKDDLVRVVRQTSPTGTVADAIHRVEEWDNTASASSRGSTVFELWASRYSAFTDPETRYAVEWSMEEPTTTPRGIGDPVRAVQAFEWAVQEAIRRFGSWDVTWGDVHRIRAGDLDLPVGGCASALGCFRVLGYVPDDDGKFKVSRGDGWVFAVEFSDPPRAYSVLAYGNSNRGESPYFYNQAHLFSRNEMKRVAFTEADIQRDLVERYRPGERRR